MTNRERFIDYVRNGGEKQIFSPQIGAGAGFDTKLAGKDWITSTSLEDTIAATDRFDMLPLFNMGLCDLAEGNPALEWKLTSSEKNDKMASSAYILKTPKGDLTKKFIEEKRKGCFQPEYPAKSADDLGPLEWYIDNALEMDFGFVQRYVAGLVERINGKGALCIQWAAQPYEILCFPNTVDTVLMLYDAPDVFKRIMDKILRLDDKLTSAVKAGGADFIFLGGPGSEMLSPDIYINQIIPYSKEVSAMARSKGLMIYSHICSPVEPFLTKGFYNQMGIDLFETLSPPPVGNVASLKDAMTKLDPGICTRGNLGLDVLLTQAPDVVRRKTETILEQTAGRKHVVAASDYLFYDIPEENLKAMEDAVKKA